MVTHYHHYCCHHHHCCQNNSVVVVVVVVVVVAKFKLDVQISDQLNSFHYNCMAKCQYMYTITQCEKTNCKFDFVQVVSLEVKAIT